MYVCNAMCAYVCVRMLGGIAILKLRVPDGAATTILHGSSGGPAHADTALQVCVYVCVCVCVYACVSNVGVYLCVCVQCCMRMCMIFMCRRTVLYTCVCMMRSRGGASWATHPPSTR